MQLSPGQLKTLSEITRDIGQVVLGTTVAPILFGIDKTHPSILVSGIVATLECWVLSLFLTKRSENDRYQ